MYSKTFAFLLILNYLKEYFLKHQYSLGMSNILTGLAFFFTGIILAQFTYFVYNVFMVIGIFGLVIGIALCSMSKEKNGIDV